MYLYNFEINLVIMNPVDLLVSDQMSSRCVNPVDLFVSNQSSSWCMNPVDLFVSNQSSSWCMNPVDLFVSDQSSGIEMTKNMIFGIATSIDLLNFITSRHHESNGLDSPLLSPVPVK